jgi:hypothetical protein
VRILLSKCSAGPRLVNNERADTHLYRRAKDSDGPVGEWDRDLMQDSPWYKDIVPNVGALSEHAKLAS